MTQPRPPYLLADLVDLTGRGYDWLSRKANRAELYKVGFPRPLPGPGIPRWPADAVDHWCRGGFTPPGPDTPDPHGHPGEVEPPPTEESLQSARNRLMQGLEA